MTTTQTPPAVGGRPRLYASQDAFDALAGRVAAMELVQPLTPEAPRSTPSDQRFVEDTITALITAGVFTGGDADMAPMSAVVEAMVVTRDVVMANLGVRRQQRLKELRQSGALRFAGILPE